MKLLIADADPEWLVTLFRAAAFMVEATAEGEEAIDFAKLYDFDLIVLDLALPDMDGQRVIRALRTAKIATPILVLSSRAKAADRVEALNGGADDFVAKPCDGEELLARVNAIVRRSKGFAGGALEFGDLLIDLPSHAVRVDGVPIRLTAREWDCLLALALARGRHLTKEAIYARVWDDDGPELKIVDVFICKLRKKLSGPTGEHFIKTIWGRGYALTEPCSAASRPRIAARCPGPSSKRSKPGAS